MSRQLFPTFCEIVNNGEFEFGPHYWKVSTDNLGYCVYKDGHIYRKYAVRKYTYYDILIDIIGESKW